MTSSRPYLIRAIHEWLLDNDMTPHLLVDAMMDNVMVPTEHVENGQIVLNISPGAVRNLSIENDWIAFGSRFNGKAMDLGFPPEAVMAIFAKENGQGMAFTDEQDGGGDEPPEGDDNQPDRPKGKPGLRVVK